MAFLFGDGMERPDNSIKQSIEENILPLLAKLKRRGTDKDRVYLTLLEKYLYELTGGTTPFMDVKWRLTGRETEICKLLYKGLTTREIAEVLSTSVRTVEHHRNHIRKKMGISKSKTDLAVYLKSFFAGRA
jgi:c-di-GMP phosphodiesterase